MTEETKTKKLTKAEQEKLDLATALKAHLVTLIDRQNTAYAAKGFDQQANLKISAEDQKVSLVYGKDNNGEDTHRVMLWILPEGQWQLANVDEVEAVAIEAASILDDKEFPKFIHVVDGKNEKFFEMDFPPIEVDQIPSVNEINNYKQIKRDPTYYWSREMYQRLMNGDMVNIFRTPRLSCFF
jgi:type I restriction enzyme M protein